MAGVSWLNEEEMATWRALDRLMSRLPSALGRQLERDADLSLLEYYVLAALSDEPEHAIRISRLAELADCELSRLSHLISRLQRRDLVERRPDPDDGRYTQAVLTDAGHRHIVASAPRHVTEVRSLIFDPLSVTEQRALYGAASKIIDRIQTQEG